MLTILYDVFSACSLKLTYLCAILYVLLLVIGLFIIRCTIKIDDR